MVQARIDSATKLLRAANDEDQEVGEDSIDRLIIDILWYSVESDWDSAPMNALMLGGNISFNHQRRACRATCLSSNLVGTDERLRGKN